jgi:quinone-modifying oxidoreductase, subunit QmoC
MAKNITYDPSFANEVFNNVDSGEEIKMCMQCGVCAASCPLRHEMDYPPRQLFTLIRAGKRDEVLSSKAIKLCTSCYRCKVRCPRGIPVIDVMHGLAHYAIRIGVIPQKGTAAFGGEFWKMVYKIGRIDEKDLPRKYFFLEGFIAGIKSMLGMSSMGIQLFLHHRLKILPERKIKGIKDLQKMLDKAEKMGKGGASK